MKIRILVSAMLFLFIISCSKEELSPSKESDKTPSAPSIVYNVNTSAMLDLINTARQTGCTCGSTVMPPVPALTVNEKLSKAAYLHSKDMADNNYFQHNNLQGLTPGQRITAAGYIWNTFGENIANGYGSEQSVMAAWLKSEGHCKNIMGKNFKEVGFGREKNYWTQNFGTQK